MFGMPGFETASVRSQFAGWLLLMGPFILLIGVGFFFNDPDPTEPVNLKRMLYGCYVNPRAPAFEITPTEIKVFASPSFVASYELEFEKTDWRLLVAPSMLPRMSPRSQTYELERGGELYNMRLVKAGRYRSQPARGSRDWTGMIEVSGYSDALIYQKVADGAQCKIWT